MTFDWQAEINCPTSLMVLLPVSRSLKMAGWERNERKLGTVVVRVESEREKGRQERNREPNAHDWWTVRTGEEGGETRRRSLWGTRERERAIWCARESFSWKSTSRASRSKTCSSPLFLSTSTLLITLFFFRSHCDRHRQTSCEWLTREERMPRKKNWRANITHTSIQVRSKGWIPSDFLPFSHVTSFHQLSTTTTLLTWLVTPLHSISSSYSLNHQHASQKAKSPDER